MNNIELIKQLDEIREDLMLGNVETCIENLKIIQDELKTPITRVEVINHQDEPIGRVYGKHNCKNVETSLQDEGRTLKIFINEG